MNHTSNWLELCSKGNNVCVTWGKTEEEGGNDHFNACVNASLAESRVSVADLYICPLLYAHPTTAVPVQERHLNIGSPR